MNGHLSGKIQHWNITHGKTDTNGATMRTAVVGKPGSGKTDLTKTLSEILNIVRISSGDLVRKHGFAGSDEEKHGQLAPNEPLVRKLVKDAIGDSDMYILDGFPRTIDQVEEVDIELDVVIYLDCADFIALNRVLDRGRPDDTAVIWEQRHHVYLEKTLPLAAYYNNKEMLVTVNANQDRAEVVGQAVVELANKGLYIPSKYVKGLIKSYERGQSNNRSKKR